MIGEIFKIKVDGKEYDFEHGDNNTALEINAAMMTVIHQSNLDDDEKVNNVSISRGLKGKVLKEIQEIIIKCSHTPKLTEETYGNLEPMSIPIMFFSLYTQHIKIAKDKKKVQPTS